MESITKTIGRWVVEIDAVKSKKTRGWVKVKTGDQNIRPDVNLPAGHRCRVISQFHEDIGTELLASSISYHPSRGPAQGNLWVLTFHVSVWCDTRPDDGFVDALNRAAGGDFADAVTQAIDDILAEQDHERKLDGKRVRINAMARRMAENADRRARKNCRWEQRLADLIAEVEVERTNQLEMITPDDDECRAARDLAPKLLQELGSDKENPDVK